MAWLKYKMVKIEKMKAWIAPTNMSNDFQIAFGNHMTYGGKSAINATRTQPAKILPKSRSDNEIGLAISSTRLIGARKATCPLSTLIGYPMMPRRQIPAKR